jgi:hypothetical protein
MQIKVKALQNLAHGRFNPTKGQEFEVTKGEADELLSTGLVSLVQDQDAGEKSAPELQNKMEDAPSNKAEQPEESDAEKPLTGKAAPRKTASKKAD